MKDRMKVFVTEVGGCQLKYWFERQQYPKGPNHIKSYIGTVAHHFADQLITDGEIKEKKVARIEEDRDEHDEFLEEVINQAYAGGERYIDNINKWIKTTKLLNNKDTNYILDFKTGKNKLWKSTKLQMGGYLYLMEHTHTPIPLGLNSEVRLRANLDNDYFLSGRLDLYNKVNDTNNYDVYIVFLGETGDKMVRKFTPRELKESIHLFNYELPRTLAIRERIHNEDYRPPASSYCSLMPFCSYRGSCVGI